MATPAPPLPASSSATLWATPSKEWVIPAKPKPGRKPKKDVPLPTIEDAEVDAKGRRVQNRAAQRAFRERKQSQLADLQARVQQYEQGEIERNVALQNIAKRMKEENEKLRKENVLLKEKLIKAEEERDALRNSSKKRWRDDSFPHSPGPSFENPSRKKTKVSSDPLTSFPHMSSMPVSYMSSPSSISSSESHTSFSPMPVLPPPRDTPVFPQGNALSNIFDFISTGKTNLFEPGGPLDTFDCGFCNENTPCVCRELAIQQVADRLSVPNIGALKVEDQKTSILPLETAIQLSSPPASHSQESILDNLPAYEPPVPLRRRAGGPTVNTIFPISALPTNESHATVPTCSGDPSNCMACADDPFGKAFCAAISKSVASSAPCGNCPSRSNTGSKSSSSGCCGNPAMCGRSSDKGSSSSISPSVDQCVSRMTSGDSTVTETIPCDDAWRQIKSHPNVAFADLELLAEVVARRSKCTGPRVEISPAPGSITPERGVSPSIFLVQLPVRTGTDSQSVLLTDPHAHYHEKQRERVGDSTSSVDAGSQDVHVSCGRSRVREVQADGVRDALRLLDSKFSVS